MEAGLQKWPQPCFNMPLSYIASGIWLFMRMTSPQNIIKTRTLVSGSASIEPEQKKLNLKNLNHVSNIINKTESFNPKLKLIWPFCCLAISEEFGDEGIRCYGSPKISIPLLQHRNTSPKYIWHNHKKEGTSPMSFLKAHFMSLFLRL